MKLFIIFFVILSVSCDKKENDGTPNIEGRWELVEEATLSLENVLVWNEAPENRRYILTFNSDSNVEASNRDCLGTYSLNNLSGVTLMLNFTCTNENLIYLVQSNISEDGELVLDDISEDAPDEGLRIKLKRL